MNKNIIAISGVAGSGKGSVWRVLKNYPDKFGISISYTTREAREGEIDGREYHFVSDKEFDLAIKDDEFLEWEQVHLDRYGTKKEDFEKIVASGRTPVLEIDVKGVKDIKEKFDNVLTIFITAPSLEVAMERLKKRGTENKKSFEKRIARYHIETEYAKDYDHIIINDVLKRAQEELLDIVNCDCS